MIKLMTYEHLESGKRLLVEFHLDREGDHWRARLRHRDESLGEIKAPTFYGSSMEQAERQLRKVFEREYELAAQETLEE